MLYNNGERLYLQKEEGKPVLASNRIKEMLESPVTLISEKDQRYETSIEYAVQDRDGSKDANTTLKVNPGALEYYLEPGQTAEMRKSISGELHKNGDKIPVEVYLEPELYTENIDTVLSFNYSDPKLASLAEDSSTLRLNRHPVKNAT